MSYLDRVEMFFDANKVDQDRQVPIFLSTVGPRTYTLLYNLVAPTRPKALTFAEISKVLIDHYQPQRLEITERYHFHRRSQGADESVAEFDAALRSLAIHCGFGAVLDDSLRDQFVCGIRHENVRRRLLTERGLTYQKALEIAKGMVAADSHALSMKTGEPAVNKLRAPKESEKQLCHRCGRKGHVPDRCKFKDATCHACGKKGHIAPVCKSKSSKKEQKGSKRKHTKLHQVHEQESDDSSSEEYVFHHVGSCSTDPIHVQLLVNGKQLRMEVDTGAALSIISEKTREAMFPDEKLRSTNIVLKTYTNERMQVLGTLNVRVQYKDQLKKLVLVVIAGQGPSLFGRNWLNHINLQWKELFAVRMDRLGSLNTLMRKYQQLFSKGLGKVEPYRVSLQVQPGAKPRFFKPRPVPFAIKDAVGKELDTLEKEGILRKVTNSDWAAPIVAVPKKDGRFRICGDYKVTINQVLDVDQYPLPKPDELFATLAKGKVFSKLDLSQAYLQLQLDEKSIPYVTINTHQGLYSVTRLPFGVASAPAIFQKMMDTILRGMPGVLCYIDDILVSTEDEESHFRLLQEVFSRLEKHGFRLKQEKCHFLLSKVDYLGHQISCDGIQPLPTKIEAIVRAPIPRNVSQLRSFLGLVNYYGKFIPNLSSLLRPLNELLTSQAAWRWSGSCNKAFMEAKQQIASAKVLTHYDPKLPITLAADASAYGIGAVISHRMPDGTERPIAFASRTLTSSEKNYAQLEKEALSLVYGVKKFHQYLYGRKFTLLTDHQPLTTIFNPKKGIPPLTAARLQRWALLLSAYCYDITYKSSQRHSNADGLSRLPLTVDDSISDDGVTIFNICQIEALPLMFQDVKRATRRDRTLSQVLSFVKTGWPQQVPDDVQPYVSRRDELSVEDGCLLWGTRVVIPKSLQETLLQSLHVDHPGISRMKAVARSYFWWIGLDKDIESLGRSCDSCQAVKSNPATAPLHPWVWPDSPWARIHVDFAGPFLGKMFLVVIDAHSKWPEVIMMNSTTSLRTIEELRSLFGRYGLPEQLVSDNGSQFKSSEFADFMRTNGIKHIRSAPYHPTSNGQAERFVQTLKRSLKASDKDGRSLPQRLAQFLLGYRTTPHATTNCSPGELFLRRSPRTRFDLLRRTTKSFVNSKQAEHKEHHDHRSRARCLFPGSPVMVRNYHGNSRWIPGTVVKKLGPISYCIDVGEGKVVKRHIDQLRQRVVRTPPRPLMPSSSIPSTPGGMDFDYPHSPDSREPSIEDEPSSPQQLRGNQSISDDQLSSGGESPPPPVHPTRKSTRITWQPDRFDPCAR